MGPRLEFVHAGHPFLRVTADAEAGLVRVRIVGDDGVSIEGTTEQVRSLLERAGEALEEALEAALEEARCAPGCLRGEGHDGDCLDDEDVAEGRLRARDYEGWAGL